MTGGFSAILTLFKLCIQIPYSIVQISSGKFRFHDTRGKMSKISFHVHCNAM